ncbi:ISL3 family transposase [Arthrobacter echini]|uniref:ISL3 family transposase n=1 Tax=Arthrobacter echini TaxID=1529066 RepID=A0A5D0XH79_9MICC|nr:ISL3 family transposase [Arthrobacter echini]TYC95860.1 ISL3 family transposase [Arthrobacter echini]
MSKPTLAAIDAATTIFNLPGYRVLDAASMASGRRRVTVESVDPPGCPGCGAVASRLKERRLQRVRDIPVGGLVELVWAKRRWFCDEALCARKSFSEATVQVPRFARSTRRLTDQVVSAVIGSGRAVSETAASFKVSWWLVQNAVNRAALALPDVDSLAPRMLGIDEHRYRSVRFFQNPTTKAWRRYEPWMSTIVDLDTGQILGIVDGRDSTGVGDWLKARPLAWRLGVQVVAIDPSAAFRKALRMWLPRTAVSVDAFHLSMLANNMVTEVRQRVTQETRGRRGRSVDPSWANRRLLLKGTEKLSDRARNRLDVVFAVDDPTGRLEAVWKVKEHLRALLRTGSLHDAEHAKAELARLVDLADLPETRRLYRTICRWWPEIEVLITTGATTAKVEANNTAIKHIKRTARGYRNPDNYRSRILLTSATRTAA